MIRCIVNNKIVETSLCSGDVALDLIREELRLTGTKEGCREGECGACTILLGELQENGQVEYKACASCLLPVGEVEGKHIVTVEGLNLELLTPVQQVIFDSNASQCGFCTPGIILSLTGFLLSSENFDYKDAIDALDGNICRCTGYVSIMNAAEALCNIFKNKEHSCSIRIEQLIGWSVLPAYFNDIPSRLVETQNPALKKGYRLEAADCRQESKNVETQNFASSVGKLVAGGTDLLVQQPEKLCKCKLEFISKYPELSKIDAEKDFISIGGGITTEEFRKSEITGEYFPNFKDDLLLLSSTIIRNRATVAGNIVNASPIGDLTIILLALNSELEIFDGKNTRSVMLKDFYKDYKKYDLKDSEIITRIKIPKPKKNSKFSFEKVSNRKYLDIASCNSAISFEYADNKINNISISAGGVAPIPMLLKETCGFLNKKEINNDTIHEAGEILLKEVKPIDDIRGSAKYKKLLLRQLLTAHFTKIFPELSISLEVK
jgi:xanthine dehydrogenase small subunit